ncbi:MAG TPA: hypothetical protein PK177_19565, partial [Burkholderiaceae bacterium]|nr:hypothetical protein [Burkholderiaceae bacterium]
GPGTVGSPQFASPADQALHPDPTALRIAERLRDIDPDSLSARDALDLLYSLHAQLADSAGIARSR